MSASSASHWYSYWTLPSPSASTTPSCIRRQRFPHLGGPADGGCAVAGLLELGAVDTAAVVALVNDSSLPASSVKLTCTLIALPWSAATRV